MQPPNILKQRSMKAISNKPSDVSKSTYFCLVFCCEEKRKLEERKDSIAKEKNLLLEANNHQYFS